MYRFTLWKSQRKKNKLARRLANTLRVVRARKMTSFWRFIHRDLPFYSWRLSESLLSSHLEPFKYISNCQQRAPQSLGTPKYGQRVDISIIIPVYNKWSLTATCLNSILATAEKSLAVEIILADDCSTDETTKAAHVYPDLTIVRTEKNQGFLKNCNHAVKQARGRYIVLLNNDTVVLPHWLSHLYHSMEKDPTIAIAGSKILHPNGRIQEAGAVLFPDGRITHVGDGFHRRTGIFNIERDADYISGCSLMIRRSFWDMVGGFDERYEEAYCEDCDLAMAARKLSMRVVYQPASEIIHYRHQSYANEAEKNHKALKKINIKRFTEKWAAQLIC